MDVCLVPYDGVPKCHHALYRNEPIFLQDRLTPVFPGLAGNRWLRSVGGTSFESIG